MDNALQKMQEIVSGLDERLNRLRAETEAAEKERNDTQTAIRIYMQVSGVKPKLAKSIPPNPQVACPKPRPISERRTLILDQLGYGRQNGRQPIDIYKSLEQIGVTDLNVASLRTALWRLAHKTKEIESGDGRYWKFEKEKSESDMISDLLG